ncbi:MAG: hypothetical protein ACOCQ5_06110 [Halanaerobiales bacterium]
MVIITGSSDLEDFKEFVDNIKNKSCKEIINVAKKELHRIRATDDDDTEYAEILRGFLFFLQWGKKPNAIDDEQFQIFKPVLENLVKKRDYFCKSHLRYFTS